MEKLDLKAFGSATLNLTAGMDASISCASDVNFAYFWANGQADVLACGTFASVQLFALNDVTITALNGATGLVGTLAGTASISVDGASTLTILAHSVQFVCTGNAGGDIESSTTAFVAVAGVMNNLSISAGTNLQLLALGGGSAWADCTYGSMDIQIDGPATLALIAGDNLTIEACGDLTLTDARCSDAADIRAGGDISGHITAGTTATVMALGNMLADVTGYDVRLVGVNEVVASVSAQHDLNVTSYGPLTANSLMSAGRNMTLWARGDITGSYSAGYEIWHITSFGAINAAFNAGCDIIQVSSWQNMGGAFHAVCDIMELDSAQNITASLSCDDLYGYLCYDRHLLGPWPQAPAASCRSAGSLARPSPERK